MNQTHIRPLDGLRGLAILMVMFHHFTFLMPSTGWETIFVRFMHFGGYGVDLFFILSGFLITRILLNSKTQPHYFRNFYMRRILRIFPLYYFFLFLTLIVAVEVLRRHGQSNEILQDLEQARRNWGWYVFYLSNFLVAQKNSFSRGGIDITWSLAIEEHFYLFWPWVVRKLSTRQLLKFCLILVITAALLRALCYAIGFQPLQIYVLTFTRMDALAVGALLAICYQENFSPLKKFSRPALFLIAFTVLMTLWTLHFWNENSFSFSLLGYCAILFCFAQLLALLLGDHAAWQRLFSHPLMVFFGKYSYAMYLFHIPLATVLKIFIFGSNPTFATQLMFYFVALGAVSLAAWLSWNLLEKPMLKLKRFFPTATSTSP